MRGLSLTTAPLQSKIPPMQVHLEEFLKCVADAAAWRRDRKIREVLRKAKPQAL